MDGSKFDELIKRLSMKRVNRLTALRGLAVGAVAGLTGVDFGAEEVEAARSGKCKQNPGECQTCKRGNCRRKRNGKKRCNRGKIQSKANGTPCSVGTCQNGVCQSSGTTTTTTTSANQCTGNAQCAQFQACVSGRCQACTSFNQCAAGEVCLGGRCIAGTGANRISCVGENATGNAQCAQFSPFLECRAVTPATNPATFVCSLEDECPPTGAGNCTGQDTCRVGECVRPCNAQGNCPNQMNHACVEGLCLAF